MEPKETKLKEYADGWITEREGTDVPGFLKLAIPVIALSACVYMVWFMNGEVDNPDRGVLVRNFVAATSTSATLMYIVTAMIVVFGVIVVGFALAKPHK
ncbi:MAG: hypothetical protein JST11_21820 [Acidobacteria bacterium]|nr:hypothetical protein [Acidobacteriota bacterium]